MECDQPNTDAQVNEDNNQGNEDVIKDESGEFPSEGQQEADIETAEQASEDAAVTAEDEEDLLGLTGEDAGDDAGGDGEETANQDEGKVTPTRKRDRNEFFCKVCGVNCLSQKRLETHYNGSKHKKNQAYFNRHGKVNTNLRKLRIRPVLDACKDALIGLEYVMEIQKEDQEEYYICYLCDAVCDRSKIIEHLTGVKHRIKYIKEQQMKEYTEQLATMTKRSEESLACKEWSKEIEEKFGRKDMKVKNELDPFFRNQVGTKRHAHDSGGGESKRYRQSGPPQVIIGPDNASLTELMEITLQRLDFQSLQGVYDTEVALRLSRGLTEAVLNANFSNRMMPPMPQQGHSGGSFMGGQGQGNYQRRGGHSGGYGGGHGGGPGGGFGQRGGRGRGRFSHY